jgi:hypothetical protein
MKPISAGVALATLVASAGFATPARADDPPISVRITTRVAVAEGPWGQAAPHSQPYVSKPTFDTRMRVVCPAGQRIPLTVEPVWSMTIPGLMVDCTGSRQDVVFKATGSMSTDEGWHPVTVKASFSADGQSVEDTRVVRVNTVGVGPKPPYPSGEVKIATDSASADGRDRTPTYPIRLTVDCSQGVPMGVSVKPVWGGTNAEAFFVCNGYPDNEVVVNGVAAPRDAGVHAQDVTVRLFTRADTTKTLDVTTKTIRVATVGQPPPDNPPPPPPGGGGNPPPPHNPPAPGAVHRPSAPRAVHVTPGVRRARIAWSPPARTGGARINAYQVRASIRGHKKVYTVAPRFGAFRWTHLQPGKVYVLSVRAHNRAGFSAWVSRSVRPRR